MLVVCARVHVACYGDFRFHAAMRYKCQLQQQHEQIIAITTKILTTTVTEESVELYLEIL